MSSRYEELKHQLEIAQEAAHEEDEEAELARATAAVARLTAPAGINDADVRLAEELTDAASGNSRQRYPNSRVFLTILHLPEVTLNKLMSLDSAVFWCCGKDHRKHSSP